MGRPSEQRVAWRWNAKQICGDKRMSAVYTTMMARFVTFPQYIWIFPSHLMCLPHVWTDKAQMNSWSDSLEIKKQIKKSEKKTEDETLKRREWWGWAGTCFLTDPNVLAAHLLSYKQWDTLQLSPFVCINLIMKKYNHLKRHTSRLLYVNNPATLESQNYFDYCSNHPKWCFHHLSVTKTCRFWPQL